MRKNCPSAEVIVDRFHVTKMFHEELNQERIDKKTAEALKVKERAKLFTSLKGSKYILLKNAVKLSNKQKEKLNKVKEASQLVGVIHSLKSEFHALF